ncbi:hypothetical protein RJ639_020369, partial [Escallonia herrerae]
TTLLCFSFCQIRLSAIMGCKPLEKPKMKHKKGLWSPDEDQKLRDYILKHGHGCWSSIPISAGLQRNGKSCRLRWINYLRPGLKRGMFTMQEEETILTLHRMLGNKWSQMAQHLPGRTDNEIKNFWHTYLKKRTAKVENFEAETLTEYTSSNMGNTRSSSSTSISATQSTSCTSFEHMEGSSPDADQYVPQTLDCTKEACHSNLPKVLFAEWLSLDKFQGQDHLTNGSEQAVSKDSFSHYSNFEDTFPHDLVLNGGLLASNTHQGLSNDSVANTLHTQMKFEDQIFESGFGNFLCGDYLCGDFNMDGEVLYI